MKIVHLLTAAALALVACGEGKAPQAPFEGGVHPELKAHTEEFRREVITVTEGVHVAVGFALANSVMLEGDDGVVIVDTTESRKAAREVLIEFRNITSKPIKAVIYTHNHADHIMGARAFTGGDAAIPVYAHESTQYYIDRFVNLLNDAIAVRSMRMFGSSLPPGGVENDGIGPFLRYAAADIGMVRPTHTFKDRLELTVAGLRIVLVHAPGESNDQIFVWLPDKGVLLPADNLYRAFPNLYTIRGTPYRDVHTWVTSLDEMRALRPEFLVPSHTRPITGKDKAMEVLTVYRDAIQFVHDQTVRAINKGMTADEAVEFVRLPAHLAEHPWLRPYYGTVAWSVRNVFNGYLGWFSGNASDLDPLPPAERARRYKQAIEAGRPLAEQVQAALDAGDHQWAAELADHLVEATGSQKARNLKAAALTAMGERSVNANARNYYLTQAAELRGDIAIPRPNPAGVPDDFMDDLPIRSLMYVMPVRLKAENTLNMSRIVVFRFPDVNEAYTFHIRRGIIEVRDGAAENPDLAFVVPSGVWKRVVFRKRKFRDAYLSGELKVKGGLIAGLRFLALFDR